jgi:hypothetical protein
LNDGASVSRFAFRSQADKFSEGSTVMVTGPVYSFLPSFVASGCFQRLLVDIPYGYRKPRVHSVFPTSSDQVAQVYSLTQKIVINSADRRRFFYRLTTTAIFSFD